MKRMQFLLALLICFSAVITTAQDGAKPTPAQTPPGPAYLHSAAPRPIMAESKTDSAQMAAIAAESDAAIEDYNRDWFAAFGHLKRRAVSTPPLPADAGQYLLIVEWDEATKTWREYYISKADMRQHIRSIAPKADVNARNAAEKAARDKAAAQKAPCH